MTGIEIFQARAQVGIDFSRIFTDCLPHWVILGSKFHVKARCIQGGHCREQPQVRLDDDIGVLEESRQGQHQHKQEHSQQS